MSLKILFLNAEVAPFAKIGGLGDVGGSLPKALKALGHDVRVVMPAYGEIERAYHSGAHALRALPGQLSVPLGIGRLPAGVFEGRLPGAEVPIYFIAEANLFDRERVYGYRDDPYRFAFFSRAALDLCQALEWRPDVVHANDWHTAPAVTWLALNGRYDEFFRGVPSLYTIHNLAHQGRSTWDVFNYLGVSGHPLREEGYGEVNWMARGIYHAGKINAVSPSYALEIMTDQGGAHLDGLLRYRSFDLHGLLNGIDYDVWDPAADPRLAAHFDAGRLQGKAANKRALQARLSLPVRADAPLVAMVSRLDWQKGIDITGPVVHLLLSGAAGECQFVVLGSGAAEYENMFADLARAHPARMTAVLDYDVSLSAQIYAGADIFLMPSRFEPCGLGQMIAMRYGAVPVVRATGGLADTVHEGVTGFTFRDYSAGAFWRALERAVYTYSDGRDHWRGMQANGMAADFSWRRSAAGYQQLYEWAIARERGGG
ncbi:MAG: glycogen synthase [Candidatus Promineifilaceae bacterium]